MLYLSMNTNEILQAIDEQIALLQQARNLLVNDESAKRGSVASKKIAAPAKDATPKRRTMSEEGKARIAAAQKARWAKQHAAANEKGTAGKKAAKKSSPLKKAKKSPSKAASKKVKTDDRTASASAKKSAEA